MTSNERKIINFLRDAKEKTHIGLIAKKTNFSNDYTQSLCHSLARAGYIKLEDSNVCHLLKKGQGHFESVAVMREVSEPVVVTANVTLLTDEPASMPLASDRNNEDEDRGDGEGNKESDQQANDDSDLDKALADVGISYPVQKNEEASETIGAIEPQATAETEQREPEILQETKPVVAVSAESPQELVEEKTADNATSAAPLESPEKAAPKAESAKPSGGFGASLKKVVNWFTEKK